MRSSLRGRMARVLAAAAMTAALLLPAAVPAAGADPIILRAGLTQSLDSSNPYQTALVSGYEAFQLTYDLLTSFGPDLEPIPGFAESWERAADGKSITFKIRPGMLWSDGTPATSADACYSYQLNLDAIAAEENVGLGYIDPSVKDSGITAVECPDDTTMIMTTSDPSDRPFQNYVPILPKHIFGDKDYKAIAEEKFDAPLVGTGPYQLAEWKTGEFARFVRNPNYWGTQGAADEVVIQFFGAGDTMIQALKAGEIDYARAMNFDQYNDLKGNPEITTVEGTANAWTELGFNTYGSGTGKTIEGGGPSTKALQDPAFRDALGYAVDKQQLLDRVLGGYGTLGSTNIPPALVQWHTDPANPRTFDLALAGQKLDAAGYALDGSGNRLDKEGKPISLRLVMPDSDDTYPTVAQYIADWWSQLGIKVTPQVYDEGTLIDLMLPPEAGGAGNKADYDLFIWSWSGSPDPTVLLEVFRCDAIGGSSDSMWCNEEFDTLYDRQLTESGATRKATLDRMQEIMYNEAPYHILYYDSDLSAYRTDQVTNWQNQPANGTPIFTYGNLGYTLLEPVVAASPEPSAPAAASVAPGASASPAPGGVDSGSASDPTPLIIGGVAIAAVVVVGLVLFRRRAAADEDE